MANNSGPHASRAYVWYVIALLSVVNVFNYLDRMALAILLPGIQKDFQLTDSQLGLLTGLAFSVFYAVCGIPIARWADRGVRRNIVALALATWSLMTVLSGAAKGFWHLFLARVGVGAGEAGCLPASQSILCDYVSVKHRALVFSIHGSGALVGTMVGMAGAGLLADVVGWRWTFVALGVPGIVLALILRATLREPVRGYIDGLGAAPAAGNLRQAVAALWRIRTYRMLLYYAVLSGFIHYGLNQWWPALFIRLFGESPSAVGTALGVSLGLGSGVGLLLGGVLSNQVAARDASLPLKIGGAAILLACPAAVASLFAPSLPVSAALAGLAGMLWSMAGGPFGAALYSVVTVESRATAGAFNIFCTSVLGFGLGPLCVGVLSDHLVPDFGTGALRFALLLPAGLLPLLAFVIWNAARTLTHDLPTHEGAVR